MFLLLWRYLYLCAFHSSSSCCIINQTSEGSSLASDIIKQTVHLVAFYILSTLTSRLTLLGEERYISRQSRRLIYCSLPFCERPLSCHRYSVLDENNSTGPETEKRIQRSLLIKLKTSIYRINIDDSISDII